MPAGLVAGAYHLVALVDPSGALPDARRDDNVGSAPVRVLARAVLRAGSPRLELDRDEASPGEPFGVAATVRNEGNVPTAPASVAIAVTSADPRRGRGLDTILVAMPLDAIRPGEALSLIHI